MPICLRIVNGCFHATMSELRSRHRDHIACKNENIYYLTHYKKIYQPTVLKDEPITDMVLLFPWEQVRPSPEDFDISLIGQEICFQKPWELKRPRME